MRSINYYKILQVDPSAEQEVIEAAYRRLALKYHPDKNKSPEATHRMQEINEAYSVLGDDVKRKEYDRGQHYQFNQRSSEAEELAQQRREAEQRWRAQEEARLRAEQERQQREQELLRKKELAPKLCKRFLEGNQSERRQLMQEVVSLGSIAIKALIDNLCDEAWAINQELLPWDINLDYDALLSSWEKENEFVDKQMKKLTPVARGRLEDKTKAVSEVFIELAKSGNLQDVDQQVKSAITDMYSSCWLILIVMYYSAKILGNNINYWVWYARKTLGFLGHNRMGGRDSETFTLEWLLAMTGADAGDHLEQDFFTSCAKNRNRSIAEFRAEVDKQTIDNAYAEFIRSRNPVALEYRFFDTTLIDEQKTNKSKAKCRPTRAHP